MMVAAMQIADINLTIQTQEVGAEHLLEDAVQETSQSRKHVLQVEGLAAHRNQIRPLRTYVYVGETAEANGLNGRWKNYRRYRDDKPETFTNNRINRLLKDAAEAGEASVFWLTSDDPEIEIKGIKYDLNDKGQRKAIEGFLLVVEGATLNR